MEVTNWIWLIAIVGGPLIIGLAIGYAMARQRYLTPGEKQQQHEAMQRLYKEE